MSYVRSDRDSHTDRYMRAERMVSGFAFASLGDTIPACKEDWTDDVLQRIDDIDALDRRIAASRLPPPPKRKKKRDRLDYWIQPEAETAEERSKRRLARVVAAEERAERRRQAKLLVSAASKPRQLAHLCLRMAREGAYSNPDSQSRVRDVLRDFEVPQEIVGLVAESLSRPIGLPIICQIAGILVNHYEGEWASEITALLGELP